MHPIYKNFDGLEISFQGAISESILEQLREGKELARKNHCKYNISIGDNERNVEISESGSRGGYAFIIDTGFDGETWFIKDNNRTDNWNIRVSVKSLTLAMYGYKGVKKKILSFLSEDLAAIGINRDENLPLKERVSRVDFCIDFITDEFIPDTKRIVCHSKSNKASNIEMIATGENTNSIRIGSMPNKQLAIYNKTKEIITNKKSYWWDIWGIQTTPDKQIWRVEARAGKEELNNWGLRRFRDFESKIGDVMLGIFNTIRYTIPNSTDDNRSRWQNDKFWDKVIEITKGDLLNYTSNAVRQNIMEGKRSDVRDIIKHNIIGNVRSFAALENHEITDMGLVLDEIKEDITSQTYIEDTQNNKKFTQAKDKYANLW